MRQIRGVIGMENAIFFKELQGCLIVQSLIWPDTVIDVFPMLQFIIQFRKLSRDKIIHLIEFLRMRPLCPLYTPI